MDEVLDVSKSICATNPMSTRCQNIFWIAVSDWLDRSIFKLGGKELAALVIISEVDIPVEGGPLSSKASMMMATNFWGYNSVKTWIGLTKSLMAFSLLIQSVNVSLLLSCL